jgi:hypothetical protein
MKCTSIIFPALTAAVVLVVGCQKDKGQTSSHSSVGTNAPAVPPVTAPVLAKISPEVIRINAGSLAIKDSAGNQWLGEQGFAGGDVIERPEITVTNSPNPEIYRSEHYGMDSFTYPLPNGKYQVKLHFCETFEGISGPGERVFAFTVEGQAFKDFDVWAKAGGWGRAYVETVTVDITDGQLDIQFNSQVENPEINGIEISPVK